MSSVAQAFVNTSEKYGSRPFMQLVSDTASRYGVDATSVSYADALSTISRAVQHYEERLELKPGVVTRVAVGLDNRPEFFYHWLALNALGVSVVPLNPQWQSAELEYVLSHSEASLVVVLDSTAQAALASIATCPVVSVTDFDTNGDKGKTDNRVALDSVGRMETECALLYTSGTTGKPKGCMLSNEYFLSTGEWYQNVGGYCQLQPGEDRLISPLPMYHMNAMAASTMAMILTGSCIVPIDRFHPASWWDSVAECDATIMHYLGVMPAMLMSLDKSPRDQRHNLRFGFGAGLSGELHTAFESRFNMRLIEAWAMTETGCTVAVIASEEPRKVGTACFGRPPDHLDFRLVDDAGRDVAQGCPGELLVRRASPSPRYGFFSGYLKDEQATQAAWEGGYFHTGDLVYVDDDGLMHFVDRKKNVIRRSGENISAVEVEEVIMEVGGVQAVGITSIADEIRGEEVFACIVATDASDAFAQAITDHCLGRLAYYKAPGYIAFVGKLPLTATEKVQRSELKTLACELVGGRQCVDLRGKKKRRG